MRGISANPSHLTVHPADKQQLIKLPDTAVDRGVNAFETAEVLEQHTNEEFAASDPTSTYWQREVFLAYAKHARVAKAKGDVSAAPTWFQAAKAIIEPLAAKDPGNANWRQDLANVRASLARLDEREPAE